MIVYLALFFTLGGVGPTALNSPTAMPIALSLASKPRSAGSTGPRPSTRRPVSSSVSGEGPTLRAEPQRGLDPRLKTTQIRDRLAVKIPGRPKAKSKEPVTPVRVAVSQDSGQVEYFISGSDLDYVIEYKHVALLCPESAPNVLWGTVVGTAGTWDVSWTFSSGSYRENGATRDLIYANIKGDAVKRLDHKPYNSYYAPLAPFTFRVEGECSN